MAKFKKHDSVSYKVLIDKFEAMRIIEGLTKQLVYAGVREDVAPGLDFTSSETGFSELFFVVEK